MEILKELLSDKEAEERQKNTFYVAIGSGITYITLVIALVGAGSLYYISVATASDPVYTLVSPESFRFMQYTIYGLGALVLEYSIFWLIFRPSKEVAKHYTYHNRNVVKVTWQKAPYNPFTKDSKPARTIGYTFITYTLIVIVQALAAGIGIAIPQVSVMQVVFFYLFAGSAETMLYTLSVSAGVQLLVFGILRIFSGNNKVCAWIGGIIAVPISAWIHGSAHVNYADNFSILLGTYLTGGVLSAMYLLTGNTLVSALAHIGVNTTSVPAKLATIQTKGFW